MNPVASWVSTNLSKQAKMLEHLASTSAVNTASRTPAANGCYGTTTVYAFIRNTYPEGCIIGCIFDGIETAEAEGARGWRARLSRGGLARRRGARWWRRRWSCVRRPDRVQRPRVRQGAR